MKAFDRELDGLEENIVYLALVFLVSRILLMLFGRMLGLLAIVMLTVCSLSLVAGFVAILLWILRRFGSPFYARFRGPEKDKLQGLSIGRGPSSSSDQSL